MWQELKNQTDIEELMHLFGSFHDSCLKELAIRNREFVTPEFAMAFDNPSAVRLLFQRQCRNPTAIELLFEAVEEFNWVHNKPIDDPSCSLIYHAVFFQQAGLIYWAEDRDWQLTATDRNDFRWIAAKAAKWRIIENATGPDDKLLSFT